MALGKSVPRERPVASHQVLLSPLDGAGLCGLCFFVHLQPKNADPGVFCRLAELLRLKSAESRGHFPRARMRV